MTKICAVCRTDKPLDAFRSGRGYKNGIRSECKQCEAARLRRWRDANPDRLKAQNKRSNDQRRERGTGYYSGDPRHALQRRNAHLLRTYGITIEDEMRIREEQGGGCATCGFDGALVVDHCHATGKVRGLLCNDCNTALGRIHDDVEVVRNMLRYLSGLVTDR